MKSIYKTVEPTNEVCIKFSDDEMAELGWEPGQKLSWTPMDDGSFKLEKFVELELDLEEFPLELIYDLIKTSCETDKSVNTLLIERLETSVAYLEAKEMQEANQKVATAKKVKTKK
jgi:hypothetical protein